MVPYHLTFLIDDWTGSNNCFLKWVGFMTAPGGWNSNEPVLSQGFIPITIWLKFAVMK